MSPTVRADVRAAIDKKTVKRNQNFSVETGKPEIHRAIRPRPETRGVMKNEDVLNNARVWSFWRERFRRGVGVNLSTCLNGD
jgi:hypothetical protein